MSLPDIGSPSSEKKLTNIGKLATLNPNAAEFVPSALRSSSGNTSTADGSMILGSSTTRKFGKAVLDHSESSISSNYDEEVYQYWHRKLPDDITPDFKAMEGDESQGVNSTPSSMLSFHDVSEASRYSATSSSFVLKELLPHGTSGNGFFEKTKYFFPSYGEDVSSANFLHLPTQPWDKPMVNNDQLLSTVRERLLYDGNSSHGFLNEQEIAENTDINALQLLATQFPGFAAESLTEVYFANGGDLNLTIEMLTQLELQIDGGFNQNLNSKALSAPNLSELDFPALSVQENQSGLLKCSGDDIQQNVHYRSSSKDIMLLLKSNSSIPTRGAIDFASAVRKMSSQNSNMWKYDRNGSADASVGSSRSSHVLASSYNGGQGRRGICGEKVQSRSTSRAAPVWLETGEAVANMYSEMREEARDHARLRNAYFEQARQAYLIGNKALAKELSVKGQLHNMHMKAAHGEAQESIYHRRNPGEMQGPGRGQQQEKVIDLHGLHVSEAILVLKRELALLRSSARPMEQRLQIYICVGTGHHTRGSRTPSRLPIAVQRYLLVEEGLDYSEPQPGLLRVLLY